MKSNLKIAILGAGPSAIFMYKRLLEFGWSGLEIDILEKGKRLGAGMPYSADGASVEHITNVSGNEIPQIVTPLDEWILSVSPGTLAHFKIDPLTFNEYKTLPRLLFGQYLSDEFKVLHEQAKTKGILVNVFFNSMVTDIIDQRKSGQIEVIINETETRVYDKVVICTGHLWPKKHEGKVRGYFDSPYPPSKLQFSVNHPVAIRGSSLTAIDAIRTLGKNNGHFEEDGTGKLKYHLNAETPDFRIMMHSRNGLLPALRFHLEDSQLGQNAVLSAEEVSTVRAAHDGFLPLDYIFERNFKEPIREKDPGFYTRIKDLSMEEFVDNVMELREKLDPFKLLYAEYTEAERSIKRKESIYWKEMLGALSYTMNYPAKYFSAEDMLRLQRILMPLISVVIAYVPQSSAAEMLAMHKAGCLEIVAVGNDSTIEIAEGGGITYHYKDEYGKDSATSYPVFIDCIGQPHLSYEQLPFKGLTENKSVSRARLYFCDANAAKKELENGNDQVHTDTEGKYYLIVPGVSINDNFQAVDEYNAANDRIYIMAVPFIGGFNPDYSGLDFGETASASIVTSLLG